MEGRRKLPLGSLHWSGHDHPAQQQAWEGQVSIGEQCSPAVADLQTFDAHTMSISEDLLHISCSPVPGTE